MAVLLHTDPDSKLGRGSVLRGFKGDIEKAIGILKIIGLKGTPNQYDLWNSTIVMDNLSNRVH